jgi:molybdopterin molybdotransferase
MLTVEEAEQIVRENFGGFLTGTPLVYADRNYPPFDRVMMDGIAVSYDSYAKGKRIFQVEAICAAGEPGKKLKAGCLEVMTGAVLPEGADLVVQYEHLLIENGQASIKVETKRERYDSIHREGSDCRKGENVLSEGLPLHGPHIGIMASMGGTQKSRSSKVMIISTGDELVENDPLPHQIRRSNAHALKTSLNLFGVTDIVLDHLSDDANAVAAHYQANASGFDVLIYSGGVSKGKFDYLPSVWADLGVTKYFHEISQRPGKPLWYGCDKSRQTTVIGLPGNPVSSLVCLHRYFLSSIPMTVKLAVGLPSRKSLTSFIPVSLEFNQGEVLASPLMIKNSGEFTALHGSHGFVEIPKDLDNVNKGTVVKFFSWRPF